MLVCAVGQRGLCGSCLALRFSFHGGLTGSFRRRCAEQRRSAAPGFIPAAWNTGAAHSNGIYTIYTINVCEGTDCSPGVDLSTVLSVRGSVQRRRLLFPARRHMTTTDDFICRYTDQGEFRSPTTVQPGVQPRPPVSRQAG